MQDPTEGASRKLAAIMFTDIKSFSKKMAENEARAFELLKMHDAIMRVLIAKFDGKVIKSLGDSFMVDFSSAVNAVKCAVEAQKRFWNFNRDKEEFERIEIRIGIHLGDVLVREDDMIGDGVNVASRIEAVTEPNRICISQEVYQQVRNKIPIQVYELGPLQLKNIPEPVYVFEVLIESIPELSKPSESSLNIAVRKEADQAAEKAAVREQEGLREARRVEDARQRSERDQAQAEETRRKRIEDLYAHAEALARDGKLEDAERELAEIYKIDPAMQEVSNQRRQDEEAKERSAQDHLNRARALAREAKFDDAEAEVNEIFRVSPLHSGAQQMIQHIEDERYRLEEEARMRKADRRQTEGPSEDQLRIDELLAKAHQELEVEQFTEAIFTLRELFLIDPNHTAARRLEENIRQAEQAKVELLHLQQEQEEENRRIQELEQLKRRLAQHRTGAHTAEAAEVRKINYKLIAQVTLAVIAVAVLIFAGPRVYRIVYPRSASVAVLQFSAGEADSTEVDLQDALPMLLADDLGRCAHVSVVSPSSALLYDPSGSNLQKIGSALKVEYLLAGAIERTGDKYQVTVRLINASNQQVVFAGRVEAPILNLHKVRAQIVRTFLEKLEIESPLKGDEQPTANTEALALYLRALRTFRTGTAGAALRAAELLERATTYDPDFSEALALLAQTRLRLYEAREADADIAAASEAIQRSLTIDPHNAAALLARAVLNRYTQQYTQVIPDLVASLESQPASAECYRELALISLIGGRIDDAERFAATGITMDPRSAKSHFTQGLVLQFKKDFPGAGASYAQTIALGSVDSLITIRYLLNTWLESGSAERVVRYLEDFAAASPQDYRIHYWIGRAYQFAATVSASQQWLEKGLSITQRIVDSQPRDAYAFGYGGLLLTRLGRFADGEIAMKRAIELDPNSSELLYRRANMYAVQKENEKAIASLKQAITRKFDFAEIVNPDFVLLAREPEFAGVVYQDVGPRPAIK